MTNAQFVSSETGIPIESLRWLGKFSDDRQGARAALFFCGDFHYVVSGGGDNRELARPYSVVDKGVE